MAQSPRSPKTPTKFNYEKDDSSFWEKFSTLGRKKKIKEGNKSIQWAVLNDYENCFQKWK